MTPVFNWTFAFQILPVLGAALIVTVQATLLGMAFAVVLGLVLATRSSSAPTDRAATSIPTQSW